MDYARRIKALLAVMEENRCDLTVFGGCPNYQYLTGDLVNWRSAPDHRQQGNDLFVYADGTAFVGSASPRGSIPNASIDLSIPDKAHEYGEWLKEVLGKSSPKKIGIGGNLGQAVQLALFESCRNAEIVDASHWLDDTRAIKDAEEISRMRAVCQLTDEAVMAAVDGLREGVSMNQLALDIEFYGRRSGASGVSFDPFAGYMKLGAGQPDDIVNVPFSEGLSADTAICFDVGFVKDGYASDWGRSVYWGDCPAHISDAYKALVESMLETVALIYDGSMRACDVYPAIEKALDKRGFGEPLRRRLAQHKVIGHSIGVEVHESPWLGPSSKTVLREGMTIAIEPKLWVPGEYYLRLEEIVLVGKRKSEFLTNFDRGLFQLHR